MPGDGNMVVAETQSWVSRCSKSSGSRLGHFPHKLKSEEVDTWIDLSCCLVLPFLLGKPKAQRCRLTRREPQTIWHVSPVTVHFTSAAFTPAGLCMHKIVFLMGQETFKTGEKWKGWGEKQFLSGALEIYRSIRWFSSDGLRSLSFLVGSSGKKRRAGVWTFGFASTSILKRSGRGRSPVKIM